MIEPAWNKNSVREGIRAVYNSVLRKNTLSINIKRFYLTNKKLDAFVTFYYGFKCLQNKNKTKQEDELSLIIIKSDYLRKNECQLFVVFL